MRIDQRNAGASGTTGAYTVDRWAYFQTQTSKGTWQQNAGSVTPPAGFTNYLGFTSSSAYSIVAGDIFMFRQFIEGFNTADLAWGTANAKTITISFWVRSSLTGTFGGSLLNSAENRSYPFTYTISSANTWEQKTITIAGDTTGTWLTTNGVGIEVVFGLGVGSTYTGTANSWQAAQDFAPTGATSVVGTNGATWYVTGVQLEVGSSATPFERRLYDKEFASCQRYYQAQFITIPAIQDAGYSINYGAIALPVTMRTAPTTTTSTVTAVGHGTGAFSSSDIYVSNLAFQVNSGNSLYRSYGVRWNFTYFASAEL
jgi:hypothetical protein